MKRLIASCSLLLAASLSAAATPPATPAPFDVAVTVDDLSVHGPLPQGMRWAGIALSYIATLKEHRVPQAWGFVNAKRIAQQPASEAVLDEWRKAGYPLGNHTYSHLGLSQAPSLQAWIDDAVAGEPAVAARMAGADWRVLRFPFLDGGADQARHDGAAAWLAAHGYRIADVSLSFDDWAYTDAYARCLDKGDQAAIAAMKDSYLKRVDAAIVRTRALSQRVYGRMIPQVLLTHLGAWSAVTLPEVMVRLDAAGARYVTLARAQSDPAYAQPGGGSLIARVAKEKGVTLTADAAPGAAPQLDIKGLCR